jgi:lysophospholipase L1-like esterase
MKVSSLASVFLVLSSSLIPAFPGDRAWFAVSRPTSSLPRIEEDRAGALRALWLESVEGGSTIILGRVVGDSIEREGVVAATNGTVLSPDLDFDPLNRPWIAWIELSGQDPRVCVRDPVTDRTWRVSPPSLLSASRVKVLAGGPSGVWVFWTGHDRGRDETFLSRFNGSAWSPVARLGADASSPRILLDAALDQAGRPWVVWSRYDGEDYEVYSSRWEGSGWSGEETLTDDAGSDAWPGVVFLRGSLPVVVWANVHGRVSSLRARVFAAGAWGPTLELLAAEEEIAEPRVSARDGRLVVSWRSNGAIHSMALSYDELRTRRSPALETGDPALAEVGRDENAYTAFGDEITYGWIDNGPAVELGYVPRLETLLAERFGPSAVANEGVPGETTVNGLGRMSDVLARNAGRYLLLMEGTNDVVTPDLSLDTSAFNLEQMVLKCVDTGVLPVLATIIPRNDIYWADAFFRKRIQDFNEEVGRIALNLKLPFVDMFNTFLDFPEADGGWPSLLSDPAHPNELGYEVIARTWAEAIGRIPFPPSPVTVRRSTERSLLADRTVNFLTWRHSPKIANPFLFRSYRIFKKDLAEPLAEYRLIAVLPYSPFHNPQKYNDLDILEAHSYRYAVSLVAVDGIEGPLSDPADESEL